MRPGGRAPMLQGVKRWYRGRGSAWRAPEVAVYYSSKIRACLGWWKAQKAPRLTVSVLRNGYRIPFATQPPPLRKSPVMVSDSDVDFILDDLLEGAQVGAYIPLEGQGKEYLARGRVDRKAGKPRLILNFRHVNAYVRKQEVRYQSLNDLRRVLTPDCWMFSWDASRAFHHVPLHPSTRCYLSWHVALPVAYATAEGLKWVSPPPGAYTVAPPGYVGANTPLEEAYRLSQQQVLYYVVERTCGALPFGFTMSPMVWAKVFHVLTKAMRRAGLSVLIWVDDGLCAMRTRTEALVARELVQELFLRSGLRKAPGKGTWEPTQRLEQHLGFSLDSRGRGCVSVPEKRCREIQVQARALGCTAARAERWVDSKQLECFLGRIGTLGPACRDHRFHARALHSDLQRNRACSRLSRQSLTALRWWSAFSTESSANGRELWPADPQLALYTDASGKQGYGCLLTDPKLPPPQAAFKPHHARFGGYWRPHEIDLHITAKELLAVRLAVQESAELLRGKRVVLHEDNQAVCHIIANRTSRSPALMSELTRLLRLLDSLDVELTPRYIRSALNPADELSRLTHRDAWGLKDHVRDYVLRRTAEACGQVTLDPFACHRSRVTQRYASRFNEPSALGPDGLQLNWEDEVLWLSPPWALLPAVVEKLSDRCRGVIIFPDWQQQWRVSLRSVPGFEVRLPPPRLSVVPFHTRCVEPFLNSGVTLVARVFGSDLRSSGSSRTRYAA